MGFSGTALVVRWAGTVRSLPVVERRVRRLVEERRYAGGWLLVAADDDLLATSTSIETLAERTGSAVLAARFFDSSWAEVWACPKGADPDVVAAAIGIETARRSLPAQYVQAFETIFTPVPRASARIVIWATDAGLEPDADRVFPLFLDEPQQPVEVVFGEVLAGLGLRDELDGAGGGPTA